MMRERESEKKGYRLLPVGRGKKRDGDLGQRWELEAAIGGKAAPYGRYTEEITTHSVLRPVTDLLDLFL